MTRIPGQPRAAANGYKKKVAKLEARNAELQIALALAEAENKRLNEICLICAKDPERTPPPLRHVKGTITFDLGAKS